MIISFELPVEITEPELNDPEVNLDLDTSEGSFYEIVSKGTSRGKNRLVAKDG